jgi:hypothetical protein
MSYGTVIVDLERHRVVDLLADRSAVSTADWLRKHKEVEVVSRDRAGLYADGARQGAPQARQVADRFHLLQNFRETVERQLGRFEAPIRGTAALAGTDEDGAQRPGILNPRRRPSEVAEHEEATRRGRTAARQALFDQIRALFDAGGTIREIAQELGLGRRRVERWVRLIAVPASTLTRTDPLLLTESDPAIAHGLVVSWPAQPTAGMPPGNYSFVRSQGPFLRPDLGSAGHGIRRRSMMILVANSGASAIRPPLVEPQTVRYACVLNECRCTTRRP